MRVLTLGAALSVASVLLVQADTGTTRPTTTAATQPVQTQPAEDGPEIVRLTLHPSATTTPAMKYHLLPQIADERPGNAPAEYMLQLQVWPDLVGPNNEKNNALWDRVDKLMDAPPGGVTAAEAAAALEHFPLDHIETAARRPDVDWTPDFREQGFNAPLPYLNDIRFETRSVGLQIRLDVARHYAAAAHDLQTAFGLTRQLNSRPFMVQGLVIASVVSPDFLVGLDEWVGREGSPNLYWSLTELPQPMVNLQEVARIEQAAFGFTDPRMAAVLDGRLPAEQWGDLLRLVIHYKQDPWKTPPNVKVIDTELARIEVLAGPDARTYLHSTGLTDRQIADLGVEQTVGLFYVHQYRDAVDEAWKGWSLPYPQAAEPLAAAERQRAAIVRETGNPFIALGIPPLSRPRAIFTRTDQQITTLRVIEALRDYAARHGGNPPPSLDQITDLPVPTDPVTGKPFPYQLTGRVATLDALAPPVLRPHYGRRYVLTFATEDHR